MLTIFKSASPLFYKYNTQFLIKSFNIYKKKYIHFIKNNLVFHIKILNNTYIILFRYSTIYKQIINIHNNCILLCPK